MRRQGPFAWPLVAAALAAFVLAEMLFNLELVDAMASPSIDPGRVDDLTVFGKASGTFGFVLFAFSLSEPPFSFAPHSIGVVMMLFASNGINGADRSAWFTLFPLTVAALLFLYGAAGSRIEVMLVAGIATTVDVGILVGRSIESDVVSGLVVTAVGAALLAASIYTVTSTRRSSPSSSSSVSIRTSPS